MATSHTSSDWTKKADDARLKSENAATPADARLWTSVAEDCDKMALEIKILENRRSKPVRSPRKILHLNLK